MSKLKKKINAFLCILNILYYEKIKMKFPLKIAIMLRMWQEHIWKVCLKVKKIRIETRNTYHIKKRSVPISGLVFEFFVPTNVFPSYRNKCYYL